MFSWCVLIVVCSGLAQVKEEFNGDVNEELDQFIVRMVEGKLLQERIVRLANGYPTTDREADVFDADQARKEAHLAKMAKDLIQKNPQLTAGLKKKQETRHKDANKLKPNEPCHCKSGKKYKKCCMEKDELERQKEKNKTSERKFH